MQQWGISYEMKAYAEELAWSNFYTYFSKVNNEGYPQKNYFRKVPPKIYPDIIRKINIRLGKSFWDFQFWDVVFGSKEFAHFGIILLLHLKIRLTYRQSLMSVGLNAKKLNAKFSTYCLVLPEQILILHKLVPLLN